MASATVCSDEVIGDKDKSGHPSTSTSGIIQFILTNSIAFYCHHQINFNDFSDSSAAGASIAVAPSVSRGRKKMDKDDLSATTVS